MFIRTLNKYTKVKLVRFYDGTIDRGINNVYYKILDSIILVLLLLFMKQHIMLKIQLDVYRIK